MLWLPGADRAACVQALWHPPDVHRLRGHVAEDMPQLKQAGGADVPYMPQADLGDSRLLSRSVIQALDSALTAMMRRVFVRRLRSLFVNRSTFVFRVRAHARDTDTRHRRGTASRLSARQPQRGSHSQSAGSAT